MPSSVYDVAISTLGSTAPRDGFIDPTTVFQYMEATGDAPANVANALAKMRANRRFRNIVASVHGMTNAYVVAVTPTGGDVDTAPTAITIRFEFEHGDEALRAFDESNSNALLRGVAAIKRCVARALIRAETRNIEYYDPTETTAPSNGDLSVAIARRGVILSSQTIGYLAANLTAAEAAITVTKIS